MLQSSPLIWSRTRGASADVASTMSNAWTFSKIAESCKPVFSNRSTQSTLGKFVKAMAVAVTLRAVLGSVHEVRYSTRSADLRFSAVRRQVCRNVSDGLPL